MPQVGRLVHQRGCRSTHGCLGIQGRPRQVTCARRARRRVGSVSSVTRACGRRSLAALGFVTPARRPPTRVAPAPKRLGSVHLVAFGMGRFGLVTPVLKRLGSVTPVLKRLGSVTPVLKRLGSVTAKKRDCFVTPVLRRFGSVTPILSRLRLNTR
eukprot:scaffold11422_cov51-Isochrysis_galbana.AAC.1